MNNAAKITKAQAETIRRVLREGGNVGLTKGSLKRRPHSVNKTTARVLIEAGLLEGHPGRWFAGSYRPNDQHEPRDHQVFATAAGCLALRAFELSEEATT